MKLLVYIECGNLDSVDDVLGNGIDSGLIDKYATVTIDGAPVLYDESMDSAAEYLSEMGVKAMGVTEV